MQNLPDWAKLSEKPPEGTTAYESLYPLFNAVAKRIGDEIDYIDEKFRESSYNENTGEYEVDEDKRDRAIERSAKSKRVFS